MLENKQQLTQCHSQCTAYHGRIQLNLFLYKKYKDISVYKLNLEHPYFYYIYFDKINTFFKQLYILTIYNSFFFFVHSPRSGYTH